MPSAKSRFSAGSEGHWAHAVELRAMPAVRRMQKRAAKVFMGISWWNIALVWSVKWRAGIIPCLGADAASVAGSGARQCVVKELTAKDARVRKGRENNLGARRVV